MTQFCMLTALRVLIAPLLRCSLVGITVSRLYGWRVSDGQQRRAPDLPGSMGDFAVYRPTHCATCAIVVLISPGKRGDA